MFAPSQSTRAESEDERSLDLSELDHQHRAMLSIVLDLAQAIRDGKSSESVAGILAHLAHYSIMHFTTEEALMLMLGYAKFDEHRKAHQDFLQHVARERESIAAGRPFGPEAAQRVSDALSEHMDTADRDYVDAYGRMSQPWLDRVFAMRTLEQRSDASGIWPTHLP